MTSLAAKACRRVNHIAKNVPPHRKEKAIDQLVYQTYAQCHLVRIGEVQLWVFYEDGSALSIRFLQGRAYSSTTNYRVLQQPDNGETHILGTPGDDRIYAQLRALCRRLLNPQCEAATQRAKSEVPTQ